MANEEQLERFIRKHYASIYATALKFVKSPDDAQDIAQNVVVKLWENRDNLNDPQSAEDFLYIYTRNESLNFLRHAKRESERNEQYAAESDSQYDLFDTIVEEESNQFLRQAIETLAPQSKRIILLELSGKNMGEIAQLMGVSINTVRTLKYNAIRRLREYFACVNRLPRPNAGHTPPLSQKKTLKLNCHTQQKTPEEERRCGRSPSLPAKVQILNIMRAIHCVRTPRPSQSPPRFPPSADRRVRKAYSPAGSSAPPSVPGAKSTRK